MKGGNKQEPGATAKYLRFPLARSSQVKETANQTRGIAGKAGKEESNKHKGKRGRKQRGEIEKLRKKKQRAMRERNFDIRDGNILYVCVI